MRVLVTWGSERGGTEGLATIVADTLREQGVEVRACPAGEVQRLDAVDAIIVGGALYANRWHRAARRFVARHRAALRRVPVWLFSSGPLDDSADRDAIPPCPQVRVLMEQIGALGHATFGGRLAPDARGFPAHAMAKTHAGDWRNPARVRTWAVEIAGALPAARPGVVVAQPAHALSRLIAHGVLGWAACAALMMTLLAITRAGVAVALHAALVPIVFAAVARHYFRGHGARAPLPTALGFAAIVAGLDLAVVAGLVERSLAMFGSVAGTWLPLALIVLTTWAVGSMMSMLPFPKPPAHAGHAPAH